METDFEIICICTLDKPESCSRYFRAFLHDETADIGAVVTSDLGWSMQEIFAVTGCVVLKLLRT